jgi:hypothetical protein
MESTFFTLFKTTFVVIIIMNDYFKRTYPEQYERLLIEISYNIIYLFSKCQILKNRACIKLNEVINSNEQLKQLVDNIYKKPVEPNQIYKINTNGDTTMNYYTDNFDYDEKCIYIFADNETKNDTGCVNMVVLRKQPFLTNYEISNIKFLLLEVKINGNTYKIDLKSDSYNYYIVDNILDKLFFIYFLNKYQICNIVNDDTCKIAIKIIDHDVNTKELEITDEAFVIIKKDNYIY